MPMTRTDPMSARMRSDPRAKRQTLPLGHRDFSLQTDLRRTHRAIIGHTPKVRVEQFAF